MSRRGWRRILDPQERALWDHVVRSVAPLRRAKGMRLDPVAAPLEPEPALVPPAEAAPPPPPAKTAALKPPSPPPLAPLEPKARRRLSRGGDQVDARLDLHGLTQASAHRRLRDFIGEAQARGFSLVLIITGKGDFDRRSAPHADPLAHGRGILRRAVPLWLAEPGMRTYVVGFEEAGRRHGGEGALYVRIRRRRAPGEADR